MSPGTMMLLWLALVPISIFLALSVAWLRSQHDQLQRRLADMAHDNVKLLDQLEREEDRNAQLQSELNKSPRLLIEERRLAVDECVRVCLALSVQDAPGVHGDPGPVRAALQRAAAACRVLAPRENVWPA